MKSASNIKDLVPLIQGFGFIGVITASIVIALATVNSRAPTPTTTTSTAATTSGETGFRAALEYGPACYIITINGVDTAWTSACSMPCHADPNSVEQ